MKVYRKKSVPIFARQLEYLDDVLRMVIWLEGNANVFGITDIRFIVRPNRGDERYEITIEVGPHTLSMRIGEYAVFCDGSFSVMTEEAFDKVFEEVPAS